MHADNATFVEWEDIRARLVRPDLACENGVLHVIDRVIVKRREIAVPASPPEARAAANRAGMGSLLALTAFFNLCIKISSH